MFARGPRKPHTVSTIGSLSLCLLVLAVAACRRVVPENQESDKTLSQTRPLREVRYVMGTLLDIILYPESNQHGEVALHEAFATAERLDSILSTYKDDSDVSRLNRAKETAPQQISPELYHLVSRSHALSRQTDGVFDITVRPLVTLWERAARHGVPPTRREISEVRRVVGFQGLKLLPPSSVALQRVGIQIETGGIGKGFAVDAIVEQLKHRGIARAFINFGRSSMAAIGTPPEQDGWKIDLELEEGVTRGALLLRDETLTVSRERGNPFIVGQKTYAHIFDPAVGRPVEISRGAAVRASSGTDGEAYVKYLVARGEPSPFVVRQWSSARWIVKAKGRAPRVSSDFWR